MCSNCCNRCVSREKTETPDKEILSMAWSQKRPSRHSTTCAYITTSSLMRPDVRGRREESRMQLAVQAYHASPRKLTHKIRCVAGKYRVAKSTLRDRVSRARVAAVAKKSEEPADVAFSKTRKKKELLMFCFTWLTALSHSTVYTSKKRSTHTSRCCRLNAGKECHSKMIS